MSKTVPKILAPGTVVPVVEVGLGLDVVVDRVVVVRGEAAVVVVVGEVVEGPSEELVEVAPRELPVVSSGAVVDLEVIEPETETGEDTVLPGRPPETTVEVAVEAPSGVDVGSVSLLHAASITLVIVAVSITPRTAIPRLRQRERRDAYSSTGPSSAGGWNWASLILGRASRSRRYRT